jgi:hypothetical protein
VQPVEHLAQRLLALPSLLRPLGEKASLIMAVTIIGRFRVEVVAKALDSTSSNLAKQMRDHLRP